jgi:cell shape-determining protein MreC
VDLSSFDNNITWFRKQFIHRDEVFSMYQAGEIKQLKEQLESFKAGQADVISLHTEIARLTVLLEIAKGKSD